MKLGISGLCTGFLFFAFVCSAGQSPTRATKNSEQAAQIKLTSQRPEASFPVAAETVASQPQALEIKVTRVVNPNKDAVRIFVYLTYESAAGHVAPEKVLVGNFGLYPVDRPGTFQLRSSSAFARLKAESKRPLDVRVLLELRPLHEAKPWTHLEVTIAQPEWRTEISK